MPGTPYSSSPAPDVYVVVFSPTFHVGFLYLATRGGINKKGAYTEAIGISPELTQICYANYAAVITS